MIDAVSVIHRVLDDADAMLIERRHNRFDDIEARSASPGSWGVVVARRLLDGVHGLLRVGSGDGRAFPDQAVVGFRCQRGLR